jgi:hypothetical protein
MGRAVLLVLVLAFLAGAWQAHHPPARRAAAGPAFRTAPLARPRRGTAAAALVGVRAGRHAGYDRVLFTFRGALPGWRVAYAPAVRRDGGGASLAVAFAPARAHDAGGAPTFTGATVSGAPAAVREVRLAGDLEGRVTFAIGVGGRGGFRVTELTGPGRVAVDVRP